MEYSEFKEHLKKINQGIDEFYPIYLLDGKDEYLVEKVKALFFDCIDKDYLDFNASVFEQNSFQDAIDSLYTFPMFSDKRLVILNLNSDSNIESIIEAIENYSKDPCLTAIFVIDATTLKEFKVKSKKIEKIKCEFADDGEFYQEVRQVAQDEPSIEIESQACIELAKRTQKNMHRIVGEIKKLKSYTTNTITQKDVIEMVSADLDFQVYELTNAVNKKDTTEALRILNVLLKDGITSTNILKNLYDKYRMMLHIELNKDKSNDELGAMLGVKGSQVYYARQISSNYSQVKLKNCVDYLHNIQFEIVYGKRQEASALHEAILQMILM